MKSHGCLRSKLAFAKPAPPLLSAAFGEKKLLTCYLYEDNRSFIFLFSYARSRGKQEQHGAAPATASGTCSVSGMGRNPFTRGGPGPSSGGRGRSPFTRAPPSRASSAAAGDLPPWRMWPPPSLRRRGSWPLPTAAARPLHASPVVPGDLCRRGRPPSLRRRPGPSRAMDPSFPFPTSFNFF